MKLEDLAMKIFYFIATLLHVVNAQQSFQDDTLLDNQFTVVVEDNLGYSSSLDDGLGLWVERSIITVRSVKLGQSQVTHTRSWNEHLTHKLKKMASENEFYKLRLYHRDGKEPSYVHTFTDACLLYSGGVSEVITLLIDETPSLGGLGQSLVSASLATPTAAYCSQNDDRSLPVMEGYNTTVYIKTSAVASTPDTATFIQKMESMNKEKLENKDNRSFLAKYWMYIIPFVLLLVISNGAGDSGNGR